MGATVYLVRTISDEALEWVRKNVAVPDWAWMGKAAFGVEWRYIGSLVNGFEENGFRQGVDYEVE